MEYSDGRQGPDTMSHDVPEAAEWLAGERSLT
jgi:hypothetical protein